VGLDKRLFLAVNHLSHQNAFLDAIMVFCAQYIPFILAGGLIIAWFYPRARHAAFRAALSGAGALILAPIVGLLHYHKLPFVLGLGTPLITHAPNNGFPSDHASLCFGVAVSLLFSASPLGPYALVLALLVGFARIFVGVHFPTDVLAGAGLGTLVAGLVHLGGGWVDRIADLIQRWQNMILHREKG